MTTYSCVKKSSDQDPYVPESYGNDETSKYEVPVPLPEVYVVLIGRAHEPVGLYWEPQSVWGAALR
jgi:hypothetical protein